MKFNLRLMMEEETLEKIKEEEEPDPPKKNHWKGS